MQQIDKKILEVISNETKDSIDQLNVVTPSMYASIFSEFALKHNQTIENEEELAHDLMKTECSNLTELQDQASKSVQVLSKNTSKAIHAIKEKDNNILNDILKETESLRYEIEKLKASVYKDELTHVYNRKWLHDNYIDEESQLFKTNGILAIIDLNYFKQINDTHGHVIGDKVLIFIANQLKKIDKNIVRYGGDEFIVLFDNNFSLKNIKQLLHETRETILTKKLKAHDTTFKTSFSYGITPFKKGDELGTVIELADKNMYKDKIEIKKRITGI